VEETVRVRRLRRCAGRFVAKHPDLLTLALSSTQTWRRGEQRALGALCSCGEALANDTPLARR
jgi:hypothetical protein